MTRTARTPSLAVREKKKNNICNNEYKKKKRPLYRRVFVSFSPS